VREAVARLMCAVGLPALARRRQRGTLAILMYHGVEPDPLSPPCSYVIDVAKFRRELDHLRRHFHVLPLEEALERLKAGTLPDRAVALTFDDGTQNLSTHAAPALRDAGLPAAFFLATGPIGTTDTLWPDRLWLAFAHTAAEQVDLSALQLGMRAIGTAAERGETFSAAAEALKTLPDHERLARADALVSTLTNDSPIDPGPFRMLTWDQARDVADSGDIALYPHTVTHPILARCPDAKVDHEIAESCAALERETGSPAAVFAYPNGRRQDFDERAISALRRCGVRWALATTHGVARRDSDPFALPRIGIGSTHSFAAFRLLVSGALS
jgi:peptidoglycan/xylan/chitin deacetylase (PgdA/CDA1 family)